MKGSLQAYLYFDGKAEEALEYYASVFGLTEKTIIRYDEIPRGIPGIEEGTKGLIHGTLCFGEDYLLLSDEYGEKQIDGNRNFLSWTSETISDLKIVWDKFIDSEATIIKPLEKTFWAPAHGILKDRFGVNWMLQVEHPKDTGEHK
ncbi:MAG: VOC family protein [Clostridiaceae bacterium]